MPQPIQLTAQRGSILAGVLALSVAMTAVAGGYVLMSGNSAGRRSDSVDDLRLHYAVEAGAMLGMRWLREFEAKYYSNQDANPPEWTEAVQISPDDFTIDGYKVDVQGIPTPDAPQPFQIRAQAKTLDNRFTFTITWGINSAQDIPGPPKSMHYTDFWVETYQPIPD